jgi:hypothetical protein
MHCWQGFTSCRGYQILFNEVYVGGVGTTGVVGFFEGVLCLLNRTLYDINFLPIGQKTLIARFFWIGFCMPLIFWRGSKTTAPLRTETENFQVVVM